MRHEASLIHLATTCNGASHTCAPADYGSPDDPVAFKTLLAISPLHNVRMPPSGTRQYPAMLLTTGVLRTHPGLFVTFLSGCKHQGVSQSNMFTGVALLCFGKCNFTCMHDSSFLHAGDHDDRVVPLHSHKLTATLQHVLAGGPDAPQRNPLLTRVEVRAGHGAGMGPQNLNVMYYSCCARMVPPKINCCTVPVIPPFCSSCMQVNACLEAILSCTMTHVLIHSFCAEHHLSVQRRGA